jgi:3-methyladenine DNA glycosylase AlkD
MANVAALVRRAAARLEALARTPSDHPASGGYGTRLRRLGLKGAELHAAARELARDCRDLPARGVVRVAQALVDGETLEGAVLAGLLLDRHGAAAASLTARDLERLAQRPDNWVSADTFACLLSGPAWRRGQVNDALIARWARSPDSWWRRIAIVSTVPLNLPSRGGTGDVPRTLRMCRRLAADHDDMVVKGLSWALREAAKRDPGAVRDFLARHRAVLAARVLREVTNKLTTGRKNPRSAQAAAARSGRKTAALAGSGGRSTAPCARPPLPVCAPPLASRRPRRSGR